MISVLILQFIDIFSKFNRRGSISKHLMYVLHIPPGSEVKIPRDPAIKMSCSLISQHWNYGANNKGGQGGGGSQLSWSHSPRLPFWCCHGNNLLGKLRQSEKVEHGLKLEMENNVLQAFENRQSDWMAFSVYIRTTDFHHTSHRIVLFWRGIRKRFSSWNTQHCSSGQCFSRWRDIVVTFIHPSALHRRVHQVKSVWREGKPQWCRK